MQLRQGTLLQGGKYRIVSTLGQGGFGITYLAEQPMLERRVCIKEFFFKEYCEREDATSHVTITTKSNAELVERFRKKFVKEARVISKLHHDHIIQIHDIFEENATAYYVMDYVEGESLGDIIKRVGFLPEQQALAYIRDVADALAYIHSKSINHLDVKPGNIMLRREDHRVLLIDFGVSKQYDQDTFEGTTTTPVGISHGYSPAEQYRRNGVQSFSPQSDVYALAATLYKMLTGVTPPEAIEVQDEGLPLAPLNAKNVSSSTITAIVNAMKSRTQRTQNIEAFLADLNGDVEVTVVTEPKKDVPPPNPSPSPSPSPSPTPILHPSPKPSPLKRYLLMAVVAIAVIAGAVVYLNRGEEPKIVKDYPVMANDGSVIYKWTGELSDLNLPTGKGIATFASGDKQSRKEYRGEMNSGSFESSNATLLYTNGSKFEGSFKNGMRAEGTLTITQDGIWKAVMGNNPSLFKGDNKPVEQVSWEDCQTFIGKLNGLTGKRFRLPTEAEWEYAARGGNRSNHTQYSGGSMIDDVAWYKGNSGSKTHPVKTKKPNELGLYDMSGNVWEWCQDWKESYSSNAQTNPTGPDSGSYRVCRGGSWFSYGWSCRLSDRGYYSPGDRDGKIGFRLTLSE